MAKPEPPGARYWRLIEPEWNSLVESWDAGVPAYRKVLARVPPRVGHLVAGHLCWSEVCNGGFLQFFFNSTGFIAPEALACYRAMGLKEWADLLAAGMRLYGKPYPRERAKRNTVDVDYDALMALDGPFYDWEHAGSDRWERAADRYAEAAGWTK